MQIQQALKQLGLYLGPLDSHFGGGTLSAVVRFQRARGLAPDGKVGAATWAQLVTDEDAAPPPPPVGATPLNYRCLALTGAFETGSGFRDCFCGLSGDFDGQGISFGVMQWNFGQGTLQPLLREMTARHPDIAEAIFGDHFHTLETVLGADELPHAELMSFVQSIQHPVTHQIFEPWRGYARALGRHVEFQQIQVEHAQRAFAASLELCRRYGLWSEWAVALMFDIVTQNNSINAITQAQIKADARALPTSLSEEERELGMLRIVANRRAEAANPRWVDDVQRRKLCIANGEGTVHGITYHLEQQFAIRLDEFDMTAA